MSNDKCRKCGSYAINPAIHGREEGKHLDLCDVCYWRFGRCLPLVVDNERLRDALAMCGDMANENNDGVIASIVAIACRKS